MSLPAIGALLRHASIETTAIYAKVDIELLKEVAMPWPEVQPC
jgi:site-specific recombinase XerD